MKRVYGLRYYIFYALYRVLKVFNRLSYEL